MSENPESSGRGDRAWQLICERSKAFGAGFSKIHCREAFALGTVVSQGAAGVLDLLSLQEWCLKTASCHKRNYGLFFFLVETFFCDSRTSLLVASPASLFVCFPFPQGPGTLLERNGFHSDALLHIPSDNYICPTH